MLETHWATAFLLLPIARLTSTLLIDNNPKSSFFLQLIGETEVINHINGLNSVKSTGKYGISAKYIKLASKVISPTLSRVHDNWPQQTDCEPTEREQTDRKERRLAEKGDPKYIFTIPRAILPKPSLCDEITAMKSVTKSLLRGQFVCGQLTWLALSNIYSNCIRTGCFPYILKVAQVIPIHKAGSKNLCSNYIPISIFNPFSKLFEKCLSTQLYNYFTQNKLLSNKQYGFIKHSSTSDAVMDACNEILSSLNEEKIAYSIFLDLAKSFRLHQPLTTS